MAIAKTENISNHKGATTSLLNTYIYHRRELVSGTASRSGENFIGFIPK